MYQLSRLLLLSTFVTGVACAAGLFVALAPLSIVLGGLYVGGRIVRGGARRVLWGHGTARWCSTEEMRRAGMFSGRGLILGRADSARPGVLRSAVRLIGVRRSKEVCQDFLAAIRFKRSAPPLVRMPPKNVHTVVFAPTGAGKGVSIVLPALLTDSRSSVVVDFKGENAKITARARRRMGHRIVCLDPYRIVTKAPDRLNPLSLIDPNSPTAIDDCRTIAEALVVRAGTEHEPHWNDSAELWIGAVIALVVCEAPPDKRNLLSVAGILADPERLKEAIERGCASTRWDGLLARWFSQLRHPAEKERGSILSTINRNLQFLSSAAVSSSVSATTFDPAELRTGQVTVYLVIPPDRIRTQSGLLRMWLNTLMRACVKQGLGEQKLVHYLLDEAAALGKMDSLTELVDKYRGYGLRSTFIYQSQGQLSKCWPEDQGMTLLSNASAVYFGVNDQATAEVVSKRLGAATVELESYNRSSGGSRSHETGVMSDGKGSTGTSTNEGYSLNQVSRPLLRPEEVLGLDPRVAITFLPGMPPVATRLVRHYEERFRPGVVRRSLEAFRDLLASATVLGLSLLLALVLASVEAPQTPLQYTPATEPKRNTPPPGAIDLWGGAKGGSP